MIKPNQQRKAFAFATYLVSNNNNNNTKTLPLTSCEETPTLLDIDRKMLSSSENTNWLFDDRFTEDLLSVPYGNFSALASGFSWPVQAFNASFNTSKPRSETYNEPNSKACREKLRRDRLNDKFMELSSLLEPGRPPKTDKAAILADAIRVVIQLQTEAKKLKESNLNLEENIRELKAEKNEFRDEKQRLSSEKERLEQQLKTVASERGCSLRHVIATSFAAQGQVAGNKLVPIIGYPGVAMWQFMPPAAIDTSRDHVLHPPVA